MEAAQDEKDLADLQDALSPPVIHMPTGDDEDPTDTYTPKTRVGGRLASLTPETISEELKEKQQASFRSLWMQALTEEFGNELDQLRQNDPRLSSESAGTSNATGRLPLLIDALSFGSEVFSGPQSGSGERDEQSVDEIKMALPKQT